MAEGLGVKLSDQGFDADSFVNKLSQNGEEELVSMRQNVQFLAEDTAISLKKNVYKNYSQFIETAKEISILEGEMYQLSHMLTDQKSVMNGLLEMSITGDVGQGRDDLEEESQEEDTQKNLGFLLEKVEGCSSVTEVPGRFLIHDGDLIELDPESFSQIHKVHAFLLNDSLMMATWLPHRRGPVKYKFQALFELDNLAVVNARDIGICKNAFKVLMFPDTRMFMAETPKAKRQWLDILEETKKKKAAADNQRKEAVAAATGENLGSSLSPNNPFYGEDKQPQKTHNSLLENEFLHVDWVQELPEDIDVYIAQRDFEGAVDLVERVNTYLDGCPKVPAVREYRARIEQRIKQLTEVLMHELRLSPEKSIRGGPRAARRAVAQLIRLGKSAQACDLFLKNRSAIIRYNMRQLKIEGNTTLYVKRLCEVFFGSMKETGGEFMKAFPEHFGCFSAFLVWAQQELQNFVSMFGSQIFVNKTNLSIIADCVQEARRCCNELGDIGLELTFAMEHLMAKELTNLIQEAGDHKMEAVKLRNTESMWRPTNFGTPSKLESFEKDMANLGIKDIHSYSFNTSFCWLTDNNIQFTKSYISFCDDLLKLYSQEHHHLIIGAFMDLLKAQMASAEKCLNTEKYNDERDVVNKNLAFIVDSLVPVIQSRFLLAVGQESKEFDVIPAAYRKLQNSS